MAMPRTEHRRVIRGYSMHPTVIALVEEEARRRNLSRSRVVEEALARHYGLGLGYAATPSQSASVPA